MNPHVCPCGDCEVTPFVDRCKYEAENERLREALTDAAQYVTCCYSAHEYEQPCPIGHDPRTARAALDAGTPGGGK